MRQPQREKTDTRHRICIRCLPVTLSRLTIQTMMPVQAPAELDAAAQCNEVRAGQACPDLAGPDLASPDLAAPTSRSPDLARPDLGTPRLGTANDVGPAFAALDLGTNNCRMLVGTPSGDGFRVLDSFSRIVRLGEGLHSTGRLNEAAMDRAICALQACAARLARRPVRQVRAIATEACRRATNGPTFLCRVKQETGFDFGIISSREEAELALESCTPLLPSDGRRALLFDIGGGSTELAWVRLTDGKPELIGYESLPVGVVTLAERWGDAGFTPDGFEAMVADVVERLRPFEKVHCIGHEIRDGGVRLLGTSGTVTTLAGVALEPGALPPPGGRWRRALQPGSRRRPVPPARARARRPDGAPLRRRRSGRVRAARLRGVRRDHPDLARART